VHARDGRLIARYAGQIYEFHGPLGDDWARLAEELPSRYDWIWTHDILEDVARAKEQLKSQGLL
jgi:hypothetical protein